MSEKKNSGLLGVMNKQGYILEERTEEVLNQLCNKNDQRYGYARISHLKSNFKWKRSEEEYEIDLLVVINNTCFIIECKKTEKSCFFGFRNAKQEEDFFHFIVLENSRVDINKCKKEKYKISKPFFASSSDDKGELIPMNKKANYDVTQKFLDDTIRQVFRNTKAFTDSVKDDSYFKYFKGCKYFIPIIVTNSDLFRIDYDMGNVDENGDLSDVSEVSKQDYLICNTPQPMRIGSSTYATFSTIWTNLSTLENVLFDTGFIV